jgi:hypothetical protein
MAVSDEATACQRDGAPGAVAEDHVVMQAQVEDLGALDKLLGEADIFGTRLGIP